MVMIMDNDCIVMILDNGNGLDNGFNNGQW